MRSLAVDAGRELHVAPRGRRLARRTSSLALLALGVGHAVGIVVLLDGAAPDAFGLAGGWPAPGSRLAVAFAIVWLVAGVAFVSGAYRLPGQDDQYFWSEWISSSRRSPTTRRSGPARASRRWSRRTRSSASSTSRNRA